MRSRTSRGVLGVLPSCLAGALLGGLPSSVGAQYFGQNKVVWERFDFEILTTEHFDIYYYPAGSEVAPYVARLVERWHDRLADFFDHELAQRKPLIIYQDHADFQQSVITPGLIGEGTGGFTESIRNRMVLPLTGINADNDHVIGHELVHSFQFELAEQRREDGGQAQIQRRVPLWMIEGLAEYLSQGRYDPATALQMRDAVRYDRLPDREGFIQRQLSPYQYGQAIWAYIAGRWSDATASRFFRVGIRSGIDAAFGSVIDVTEDEFFEDFHASLESSYAPVLESRSAAEDIAVPLLTLARTGAALNVAPALSPDGRWIAFLSTRELAIELYLASTETGEVVRKLVSAEADAHIGNLSFLDTSVAWSPDSRRFAFETFAEGERRIAIYDREREQVVERITIAGLSGMRHPAWSPDGRHLAFSATAGGASDLYLLELESERLTRLTSDPYTAIQPAFSPDGGQLVFVTDRGPRTELADLTFGPPQLALLDLDDLRVEVLSIFAAGKHIDPHFAGDGRSIYFVGEPDGIPDVFRYDLETAGIERVTALETGVSGLTAMSPAMSIARESELLAFSTPEDGNWNIYALQPSDVARTDVDVGTPAIAGTLPPALEGRERSLVESYLRNPERGLPRPAIDYPTRDYSPDVELTNVGPATIGVARNDFGNEAQGAVSLYFNDMLNRHQVAMTLRGGATQSGIVDFEDTLGVDTIYLNQKRRLQWGGRVSRLPYLNSRTFISQEVIDVDGTSVPADIVERLLQVVTITDAALIGQYPFSRNQRLEAQIGLSRIGFENRLERLVFPEGFSATREEQSLPSPTTLDLEQASIAWVRDTSLFGFVSPVRGSRLRIESGLTGGDLTYRTTTVDYRKYFFKEPLTFALRTLHIGRRGNDAESLRLPALDVARSDFVRGYEFDSFDLSECTAGPQLQSCPEIDRLFGSRIAVVNFEARLALLGTEDYGIFDVPAAPTELAFFIDAGAAWSSGESVDWTFDRDTTARVPVVSAGIALRSLLLGSLPIELYLAYPFQRPEEDSVFGFRIRAGW